MRTSESRTCSSFAADLYRVVEILEAAAAAGRVVRARAPRRDAATARAPRSRAPRRNRASPSSRARGRGRRAARGARRRRSRSGARHRCRRRRANRPGARSPRPCVRARPSRQGTSYVMSRRRVRQIPAAPISAIHAQRDCDRTGQYGGDPRRRCRPPRRGSGTAGTRRRRPGRGARTGPTAAISARKIQTSVPTSAPTWLCTTAPTATPIGAPEHGAQSVCAATRPDRRREARWRSSPVNRKPGHGDGGDTARASTSKSSDTARPATALASQHALAARRGEEGRRDRAVPELGRDDGDPEDDREQRREGRPPRSGRAGTSRPAAP